MGGKHKPNRLEEGKYKPNNSGCGSREVGEGYGLLQLNCKIPKLHFLFLHDIEGVWGGRKVGALMGSLS